jgi:hypothetical protein
VRRLVGLPDHTLVVLSAGGLVQVLPGGDRERLAVDSRHAAADVADIALDPDFLTNQYVYAATVASADAGRATISVVRFRELDGRFGQPASIVADLPAAAEGLPAISVGPDRRIYLAVPSGDDRRGAGPYDGVVLRLTRDGAAAGYERAHSPILAIGSSRPASFGWLDSAHLLLASAAPAASLSVIPLQESETFAPASVPVPGAQRDRLAGGIMQVATIPGKVAAAGENAVVLLGTAPPALYVARLTTGAANAVIAFERLPLGGLTPITFAVDPGGDLLVCARQSAGSPALLLRLRLDPGQKSS